MSTHQKKGPKAIKRYLENIIDSEGIREEVDSWIAYFKEDPKKIQLPRYAQHIKAALTKKIKTRDDHVRIFSLCDEINLTVFGPPTHHLCNCVKSSFKQSFYL